MRRMTRKRLLVVSLAVALVLAAVSTALAADRTGRYVGIGPNAKVTGTRDGQEYTYSAGTMEFQINGGDLAPTFCTDFRHSVTQGIDYAATEEELRCELVWLMQHYPPDLAGNGEEMAARQAAVWHFSDGFDPVGPGHSRYTAAVEGRAWELIDEAQAAACEGVVWSQPNLVISPLNASQPEGQATIDYGIEATTGGAPIEGLEIALASSFGLLSESTLTTAADGTASFSLTNDVGGPASAVITATASYTLGLGTVFKVIDAADQYQWLVLGEETTGAFFAGASAAWLPDSSVMAHVFHDLDMDGVQGDDDEIDLDDWEVTLYQADGAGGWAEVGSGNTATNGTVSWTDLAADDYNIVLTLQSGWFATTPIEVEFALPASGSEYVDLGVIRLPVVNACTFYDVDEDGEQHAGEPWLDDWAIAIVDGPGGALQGQSGQTKDGCVTFSWPRNQSFVAGDYVIQETLQDGWFNSTALSQTITLASGDILTVTFGNYQIADISLDVTGPQYAREGETITYYWTVTNVGAEALTGAVSDSLMSELECSFADLAPGASQVCQADYTIPVGGDDPLLNMATVAAQDVYGRDVEDDDNHSIDIIHPQITVIETASPTLIYSGQSVAWTIEVTNSGDDPLTGVTLTDDNGHDYGAPFGLGAGESQTFTYPTSPGGETTNVVSAVGTDSLGGTVDDDDSASMNVISPDVQVLVTVAPDTVYAGEQVTWEIQVTNTGDDPLTGVTLSDDNGHDYGSSFAPYEDFDLAVGASQTFT